MSMTDAEKAAADAKYAALQGTEPDGFSWEYLDKVPDQRAWIAEKADMWRKHGMTYMRVTLDKERDTIWLEMWKVPPLKEAPFKGHYLQASPETVTTAHES